MLVSGLESKLDSMLYGQHLVHETLIPALRGYVHKPNPSKPLVLSFHGRTGVGKNHVARLIAESLYKKGLESKYVHYRMAELHYKDASQLMIYQVCLKKMLRYIDL